MKFVAVPLPAPVLEPATQPASLAQVDPILIKIRRGGATVTVSWPTAAAGDCGVWLRELLR